MRFQWKKQFIWYISFWESISSNEFDDIYQFWHLGLGLNFVYQVNIKLILGGLLFSK